MLPSRLERWPVSSRAHARSGISLRSRLRSPVKARCGGIVLLGELAHSFAQTAPTQASARFVCPKIWARLGRMLASRDTCSRGRARSAGRCLPARTFERADAGLLADKSRGAQSRRRASLGVHRPRARCGERDLTGETRVSVGRHRAARKRDRAVSMHDQSRNDQAELQRANLQHDAFVSELVLVHRQRRAGRIVRRVE